ncbi:hypothetical protein QR680_016032 [Steinernema hermaphroditum]|uniref:Uncharacterized protein n=1 Tax=Steinernema hermaphroditum TaxID=289476 RepID=A0AA39HBY9_9BILA|nr:hypothetical protein QR680_016032 [Steinernema hermaphroditum]
MFLLGSCFSNIFVMITPAVTWCGFSVLQGVYSCVEYLAKLPDDWKYYQYLSGVDLPLKTNLEMVRIFKQLNGSFNSGIYDLEESRRQNGKPSPLPLWKSSLSATFSRESAHFMLKSRLVQQTYKYLRSTFCPDETFWTTIAGIFAQESCVYGVRDLTTLINRPELVAHKFYMEYQPAAYFCLYEKVRKRALDRNFKFDVSAYGELPGPKLLSGTPFEKVKFGSPAGYVYY